MQHRLKVADGGVASPRIYGNHAGCMRVEMRRLSAAFFRCSGAGSQPLQRTPVQTARRSLQISQTAAALKTD